jgi:NO-binding membrane sensor protein with MHYT domain
MEGLNSESADSVVSAVRHYFDYRAVHAADNLKQTLVRGALSLVIGLGFLFACLWCRKLLETTAGQPDLQIVAEGLLIMGWVAMWRPIEIFLYDWWPILHHQRVFQHISKMSITVKVTQGVDETKTPR